MGRGTRRERAQRAPAEASLRMTDQDADKWVAGAVGPGQRWAQRAGRRTCSALLGCCSAVAMNGRMSRKG